MSIQNSEIKILIIDEEYSIRKSLQYYLLDFEYNVEGVESGEEGLELLKEKKFDIIIVDLRLNGISGETFIYESFLKYKNIIYIIYTGSINYELPRDLAKEKDKRIYLIYKPVDDMTVFIDLINKIMKNT